MAVRVTIRRLEKPYMTTFWGSRERVEPKFVRRILGNGKKLLAFTPMMTRPQYYYIRVDSHWLDMYGEEGGEIADHIDEITGAIEEEYGYYFDGHSSEYEHSDGEYPGWPVLWGEGSSWTAVCPKTLECVYGK